MTRSGPLNGLDKWTAEVAGEGPSAGGHRNRAVSNNPLRSAELFDPAADTFSPTGSTIDARNRGTATRLLDGRVLLAGGVGQTGQLTSAELFDPKAGAFTRTGSLAVERYDDAAVLLSDGDVLIVGGLSGTTGLATAELYDPKQGTFRTTGSMTTARWRPTATLLADGRVLVAGGSGTDLRMQASAELYDPATGTFSKTGSMTTVREGCSATLLPDGHVLMAGGRTDNFELDSAELYDPMSGTFSLTGSLPTARLYHTATLLTDGRVLVAGGFYSPGGTAYESPTRFGPSGMRRNQTAATLDRSTVEARFNSPRSVPSVGPVIVDATNSIGLTTAETYDPATGSFSPTGSMGTAREGHTATLLLDGRVLVAGGEWPTAPPTTESASAESYQRRTDLRLPCHQFRPSDGVR
ncbi:MAG: Kelch repeat-containing protein [Candidatus Limnocylindrales bacterium]